MSSPPADPFDDALLLTSDPRFYYWGSIAHHELSSFNHFPHPEDPLLFQSGNPASSASPVEPENARTHLGGSLFAALSQRRSAREFGPVPMSREELMTLLWAGYGRVGKTCRRTAPSAGALYPLDLWVVAKDVVDLPRGVYAFDADLGSLNACDGVSPPDDLGSWFVTKHIGFEGASALVIMIGRLKAAAGGYGERGYRFLHLEAGHVGQNMSLAATLIGVPHVLLGGFDDDVINRALELETPDAFVVYTLLLGRRGDSP